MRSYILLNLTFLFMIFPNTGLKVEKKKDINAHCYIVAIKRRGKEEKWGVINLENKKVLKFQYDFVGDIGGGTFIVERDNKIGVVKESGKILIPFISNERFEIIDYGEFGIIYFNEEEGFYYYIDREGKILYQGKGGLFSYRNFSNFRDMYIFQMDDESKYYIAMYDAKMNKIIEFKNKKITRAEVGEDRILFCTKLMGRWRKCGFMDFHGNVIVPPIYDNGVPYRERFATVHLYRKSLRDLAFFINKKGELLWGPFLNLWTAYSEGYAAVYFEVGDDLKCNYINKQGERVFEENFDYCGAFSEGLAHVGIDMEKDDGYTEGKRKVGFEYTDVILSSIKFGYIDKKGKVVIPFMYESADAFINGLARVGYKGKTGLINKRNEWVIPPEYSDILYWDIQKSCIENPFAPLFWKKLRDVLLKKD